MQFLQPEPVRTNSEVAIDLSNEIDKAHDLLDKRRDRELNRQRSLQELDKAPGEEEPITDTGDELEKHLGKNKGRRRCVEGCFYLCRATDISPMNWCGVRVSQPKIPCISILFVKE